MKLLALLILTTSCALHVPGRTKPGKKEQAKTPQKTNIESVRECVEALMSKHGVEAKKSLEVCENIYRRK